jgi:hypothetical protein
MGLGFCGFFCRSRWISTGASGQTGDRQTATYTLDQISALHDFPLVRHNNLVLSVCRVLRVLTDHNATKPAFSASHYRLQQEQAIIPTYRTDLVKIGITNTTLRRIMDTSHFQTKNWINNALIG